MQENMGLIVNELCTCLVSAPIPCCKDGEAKGHAGPGKVTCHRVSEQVHGVGSRQVARCVRDDLCGYCIQVDFLQIVIAVDFVKCCQRETDTFFIWLAENS